MTAEEELEKTIIVILSEDKITLIGDSLGQTDLPLDGAKRYLAFSGGTVLQIEKNGINRLTRIAEGTEIYTQSGGFFIEDKEVSDVAVIRGKISWMLFGHVFLNKKHWR